MQTNWIVIIGAVREEVNGIKKLIRANSLPSLPAASPGVAQRRWRAFSGEHASRLILLIQSGMGKERTESAAHFAQAESLRRSCQLTSLIVMGFGGALAPTLEVGDLVFCQKLLCSDVGYTAQAYESDNHLLSTAIQAAMVRFTAPKCQVKWLSGTCLTTSQPVASPEEKGAMNDRFQAQVVDMESYWVGRIAADHGIPFLAVRAISDTASESLPPFDRFISPQGTWLWKSILCHYAAKPGQIAYLPRIYRNASQAASSLAQFFASFIPRLEVTS